MISTLEDCLGKFAMVSVEKPDLIAWECGILRADNDGNRNSWYTVKSVEFLSSSVKSIEYFGVVPKIIVK